MVCPSGAAQRARGHFLYGSNDLPDGDGKSTARDAITPPGAGIVSGPVDLLRARIPDADPRIFQMFEGWHAACDGDIVPHRSEFDPLTVFPLLPFIWIYRWCADAGDYVCDLAGDGVNTVWGNSIRGRTLTRIVGPDQGTVLVERWRGLRSLPGLLYSSTQRLPDTHHVHRAERLVLPLRDPDGSVGSLIGLSLYDVRLNRLSSVETREAAMPHRIVCLSLPDLCPVAGARSAGPPTGAGAAASA